MCMHTAEITKDIHVSRDWGRHDTQPGMELINVPMFLAASRDEVLHVCIEMGGGG